MITTYSELPNIRTRHPREVIVFAGGVFDLIHEGHVEGLEQRRQLGDLLVLGVSSDERVRERKGPSRPIRKEAGRLAVVSAFRSVDYAFLMPMPTEVTPTMQVLRLLHPDIFVDHSENRHRWEPDREIIEAMGVELVFDEQPKRDSSTDIITRVLDTSGLQKV